MITEFTTPAEQRFVDQYVPIPFEQISKIGEAYKSDYKESEKKMDEFQKAHQEFRSLSAADTKAYYNETIGKLKPIVDELGGNSDLLKSAEGRSKIAATLRNVDYGKLALIKKNAEEYDKEQKLLLEMQANGKTIDSRFYSPNFQGWDTEKQGLYKANAPVEYTAKSEVYDPYAKEIKDQLLYTDDRGREVYGIDKNTISNVANKLNVASMINDPRIKRELEYAAKQGIVDMNDRNSIESFVRHDFISSQLDRVGIRDRKYDELDLARKTQKIQDDSYERRKRAENPEPENRVNEMQREIEETAMRKIEGKTFEEYDKINKNFGIDLSNVVTPNDLKIFNSNRSLSQLGKDMGSAEINDSYVRGSGEGLKIINPKTGSYFARKDLDPTTKRFISEFESGIGTQMYLKPTGKVYGTPREMVQYKDKRDGQMKITAKADADGNRPYIESIEQVATVRLPVTVSDSNGALQDKYSDGNTRVIKIGDNRYNYDDIDIPGKKIIAVKVDDNKYVYYMEMAAREPMLTTKSEASEHVAKADRKLNRQFTHSIGYGK